MKVIFQTQGLINDNYKSFFRSNLPEDIELIFPEDNKELLELAEDIDIFVGYSVTDEFMEKAKNLKHIQIPWTGFNSLDTEILSDYSDITVSNSHSNSLAIAEHAVALLLSTAKKLVYRDRLMREGDWSPRYSDDNSFWITGKTLGIVGYGAIGQKVGRMMKYGFNMDVLSIKRSKPQNEQDQSDEISKFIGGPEDLDYVIKNSDFLLVAVPLTSETEGLLDEDYFEMMKPTAIIVNIARGPVIEEETLFKYLEDEKIGGAGIDVWYNYPKGEDDEGDKVVKQNFPFEELDNIVMSPHSAFKVRERVEVFSEDILENIQRIYTGEEPINQVNLEIGY